MVSICAVKQPPSRCQKLWAIEKVCGWLVGVWSGKFWIYWSIFQSQKNLKFWKMTDLHVIFMYFSGIRWFSSIVLYRSIRDQRSLSVRKFICRLIDGKGAFNSSTQQLSPSMKNHSPGRALPQPVPPRRKTRWQTNQVNSDSDPWTACVSWLGRNGGCFGSWGVETRGKFVKNAWFVRMELVNKKRGRS